MIIKNIGTAEMKQKLTLYYDKQCPFCNRYAAFIELKQHYDLELKNAREYYVEIDALCKAIDINEGLIVVVEEQCLQGVDALRYLDSAMEKKGVLARFHGIWSLKGSVSGLLYKGIKVLRKMVLFLMGRKSNIE
jgi:predicted DCC family thiol-disulfide oxidoreductase YuxK